MPRLLRDHVKHQLAGVNDHLSSPRILARPRRRRSGQPVRPSGRHLMADNNDTREPGRKRPHHLATAEGRGRQLDQRPARRRHSEHRPKRARGSARRPARRIRPATCYPTSRPNHDPNTPARKPLTRVRADTAPTTGSRASTDKPPTHTGRNTASSWRLTRGCAHATRTRPSPDTKPLSAAPSHPRWGCRPPNIQRASGRNGLQLNVTAHPEDFPSTRNAASLDEARSEPWERMARR